MNKPKLKHERAPFTPEDYEVQQFLQAKNEKNKWTKIYNERRANLKHRGTCTTANYSVTVTPYTEERALSKDELIAQFGETYTREHLLKQIEKTAVDAKRREPYE